MLQKIVVLQKRTLTMCASFLSICYYDKNVLKVPKSKSANISLWSYPRGGPANQERGLKLKKGRLKARVRMRPVGQVALPNLGLDSASENDTLASQESNIYYIMNYPIINF